MLKRLWRTVINLETPYPMALISLALVILANVLPNATIGLVAAICFSLGIVMALVIARLLRREWARQLDQQEHDLAEHMKQLNDGTIGLRAAVVAVDDGSYAAIFQCDPKIIPVLEATAALRVGADNLDRQYRASTAAQN